MPRMGMCWVNILFIVIESKRFYEFQSDRQHPYPQGLLKERKSFYQRGL